MIGPIELKAQNRPVPETQVMAVFLFNFTQFTEWPKNAFTSLEAPLVIGIIGTDPFGKYLEETVSGETVQGHPIIVERYKSIEDIRNCHVLYINERDKNKIAEILNSVRNKSTLTISDHSDFSKMGGMIAFKRKNNKIKLQANPGAAKSAGLILSSKLLRVSDINN
jgi:hypothetical protein